MQQQYTREIGGLPVCDGIITDQQTFQHVIGQRVIVVRLIAHARAHPSTATGQFLTFYK
jgi:hypothetical protein